MSEGHPDSPGRLTSIEDRLQADGIMEFLMYHDAPLATRTQLERAHSARHVETLSAQAPDRGLIRIDPDTYMGPRTLEAAWRAAGGGWNTTMSPRSGSSQVAILQRVYGILRS